jgi:ubiquinone/menaquinone biosynthesis C-methylase UbiE
MRISLPLPLLLRLRQARYFPAEVWDWLRGRRDPLLPPRWLRFVGGGDFTAVGDRFLHHFQTLAKLRPEEDVLDVGCGVGRIALALTRYLKPPGSYRGFDIVPEGIRWCQGHITPRCPHFQFQHVDVKNAAYNSGGRMSARDFVFPYCDASVDFVFLASVFTHMQPFEMSRYLREVRRVLRPAGRCFATFFILNQESRQLMVEVGSLYHFGHDAGGCFTTSPDRPEAAIAYDENELRQHLTKAGMKLDAFYPGGWCGRERAVDGQDIVLVRPAEPDA